MKWTVLVSALLLCVSIGGTNAQVCGEGTGLFDNPCPANSVFTIGTTCCPATCQDLSAPNSCTLGVTDGCQCDGTRVWSKNNCVEQPDCGCTDPDTGTYYELNEVWTTPDMQECECTTGGIIICNPVDCDGDGGYTWELVDGAYGCDCTGDCCDRTICKASGDPHTLTPDVGRHDYQGCGLYTFAKDCTGNTFNVETKHVPLDENPDVTAIRAVYVTVTIGVNTFIICLLEEKVVLVDGVRYALPVSLANGDIEIHLTGRFVRLELVDLCVVVYYDGVHYVKMEIPRNYEGHLCGLCGNFNGDATDDLMLPDGSQAANENQFGNSWQTQPGVAQGTWDLTCGDLPTGEPPAPGPCDPMYTDPCDVLLDANGPFAACHAAVDPTPYYDDCVSDACAKDNYLCPTLETYYDCCMEAGVSPFVWRSDNLCKMDCPANSVYSSCMSACPATCVNPDAPDNCDQPCVEGCECVDGYILSDRDCVVDSSGCGCTDIYDNYHPLGEPWGTEDGQQCECVLFFTFLFADCQPVTCQEADGYYWTLVDGVYGCHCVVPCCGVTCENGGTCVNGADDSYTCDCAPGYEGDHCETPKQCPTPMAPGNGAMSPPVGPYYYQDEVTFSCDEGYELVGVSSVTCLADQTWSAPTPTCEPLPCATLMPPVNGALSPDGPYVYLDVVTFTCDPGYTLNGAPSVTCLSDQTWSDVVPTCEPNFCPDVMPPVNGDRSPAGPYLYPNVITFSCDPGYELNGPSSVMCEPDGTWSAAIPTCERVQCPYRMAPENGAQSSEGPYYYGDVVTYTCDEGYELAPGGASSVTCQADETWSADVPTCQRVQCPYRMAPENGAQSSEGPYFYEDEVTYSCDLGYELAPGGASSVTCQADTTWSADVPTCQRVQCPYRMAPENGAQSSEGPYFFGDEVTYSCDQGYELAPGGASSATCQADETWSADVPTCQRVQCPYRMAPENGAQSSEGPYFYEDVVTYSCDLGYELAPGGASSVTCQADTTWSADVPTCQRVECPYRMAPVNGAQSSEGPYFSGDQVTYSCDEGYELDGSTSATCLPTTMWSDDVPTCQRVQCPYRMAPENGAQSSEGPYYYEDEVTYSCDQGYELAPGGASSVTCLADTTWSADVPTCQRVQCPYRMAPENGAQSSEGPYFFGDEVTYSCDLGYELAPGGASSVTCQADTTWSADVPTCQRVECPYRMAPVNGAQSSEGPYYSGDQVTYSCDEGYELDGSTSATCLPNTMWSDDVPTCQRVQCPYRMAPENGAQSSEGPYYFGDVVTYSCDQGYELDGASGVTCQADQTWSATVPTCNDIDECDMYMGTNNCHAQATCTNTDGSFTCTCNDGYTGNGVSCTDINECTANTDNCHEDATCGNTIGSFTCTCNPGYTGSGVDCDDIDECEANTDNCHNDAACANTDGSFNCTCNDGYTGNGVSCTDINECTANTDNCHEDATCGNTIGSFTCSCNSGYTGSGVDCDDIDECEANTDNCHAHASCANTDGNFTCTCDDGYTGDGVTCTDINECTDGTHNCDENATCTNTDGSFECTCNAGYTGNGVTCTDTDGCDPDPCVAIATCTDIPAPGTGATCTCPSAGYYGDGKVHGSGCQDVPGCDMYNNPCHPLATCTDVPAPGTGAVCMCPDGYEGDGTMSGTGCTEINGCNPDPCDPNAECTDNPPPADDATCECDDGYEGNGFTCTDINECETDTDNCDDDATCGNTIGSFTCTCNPGYTGDGVNCDDVDECTTGTHNCHTHAFCTDTDGGFTCTCNDGYTGNGVTCTDIDECAADTDNCHDDATCTDTDGSFTCTCDVGYTGDGVDCDDIDECAADTDNCHTHAACTDTDGSFTCSCNDGYTGDGVNCVDIDECAAGTDNCDDDATCSDTDGSFVCTCNVGYTGDGVNCDDIDECTTGTDNCDDDATCTNTDGSFTCTCNDGYTGDGVNCDDIDECTEGTDNCDDDATCTNTDGSFTCTCNDGYTGDGVNCTDIDECATDTDNCGDHANCTNTDGGFFCTCNEGYFWNGVNCDEINDCVPNPCVPMATCEDRRPPAFGAVCHCPPKYFGDGLIGGTGCQPMTRDDLCEGPERGICRACGDPHTKTFDKRPHHFQGPCRYIFAKDCGNNDFSVEVQHVPVPRRPVVSVVREVFVIAHGYEIGIHQGNDVTVDGGVYNGDLLTPPFSLAMGKIRVRFRGIWVHVRLVELCVDVYYNGRHCVKVKVSPYYCDRMCGLCGNFNYDRSDDFMMSDLVTIATNWNDFGYSWLVQDEDNEMCIGPPPPPPCRPEIEILANDLCGIITANNGPFAPCHAFEDPSEYFGDCFYDICAQDGDIEGLCDNLEAYADACDDEGVSIIWRTPDLCPLPCPPNSHYNPCASPCPPTCQDPNPICIQVCVECCECDDGYIMSGQHCVPVEECGCIDPETGRYYELGATWVEDGSRCECRENNNIVCKGCSFDVVFILDRSSSIGPYGMYIARKYIAYIIRCLFGLDVEVGYIVFDCISKWLISLGLYTVDTAGLIPQIKAAEFTGGESRSGSTIRFMRATANYRNGIPKAAVVLTDGVAYGEYPSNLYEIQSDAARAMGIEMYAVAVGREYNFNYNALAYIAGGYDRVFDRFSCCYLAYRLMDDLCVFPPRCDVNADLFFVLDSSGSVSVADFDRVKDFVVSVVSAFTISLTDTRVGVSQYSTGPQMECNLGDHADQPSFVNAINTMQKIGQWTNTGDALEFARTNANWRDPPIPKIMIVLTDGKSQDSVVAASQNLANDGITAFAIGVGNFDSTEVLQIANNNADRVFELDDYAALTASIDVIVEAVCSGA
ncbi:uncharacterized protein LOC144918925 isoform X3 [Branchiostoma floridae x Branchiostoma belcheri]